MNMRRLLTVLMCHTSSRTDALRWRLTHLMMARRLARGSAIARIGVTDDHGVPGRPGRDVLLEERAAVVSGTCYAYVAP